MKRIVLPAVFLFAGCLAASARGKAITTASFEHHCPEEKVTVISESPSISAYELDVCGERRLYRDMGNEKEFQFVDVTAQPAQAPRR